MKYNTNESGITLIALTVLLIVIVILAGISTSTFLRREWTSYKDYTSGR